MEVQQSKYQPSASKGMTDGPLGALAYSIEFNNEPVPEHPNCLIFDAWDAEGTHTHGPRYLLQRRITWADRNA